MVRARLCEVAGASARSRPLNLRLTNMGTGAPMEGYVASQAAYPYASSGSTKVTEQPPGGQHGLCLYCLFGDLLWWWMD